MAIDRRGFLAAAGGGVLLGSLARAGEGAVSSVAPEAASRRAPATPEGWMEGFPPPPERVISFADNSYARWPQLRWSFNHIEELVPTRSVWRGTLPEARLASAHLDLGGLTLDTLDRRQLGFPQALEELCTDGLLVLHRGRIVYEQYFAHGDPLRRHITMSTTKSLVGTVAEDLVQRGELERDRRVPHYVPELAGTAWSDATLGDVLDMQVGMGFDEDYSRPDSEVYRYLIAAGMVAPPPGYRGPRSFYQYLPTIEQEGEHGKVFAYREPNINVLGWVLRRVSGVSLSGLLEQYFWSVLGMERDAYFMLDGAGGETTLCATLRDFARFGELIRNHGQVGGRAALHPRTVEALFRGGDREKFAAGAPPLLKGSSYVAQWWVRHEGDRTVLQARGAYGQFLHIDPRAEIVVAHFGSARQPSSVALEGVVAPLFRAIVGAVSARG